MAHFQNELLTAVLLPAAGPCFVVVGMVYVAAVIKECIESGTTTYDEEADGEKLSGSTVAESSVVILKKPAQDNSPFSRTNPTASLLSAHAAEFHRVFSSYYRFGPTTTTESFSLPENTIHTYDRKSYREQRSFASKFMPLSPLVWTQHASQHATASQRTGRREAAIISELLTGQPPHERTFQPLMDLEDQRSATQRFRNTSYGAQEDQFHILPTSDRGLKYVEKMVWLWQPQQAAFIVKGWRNEAERRRLRACPQLS